MNLQTNQNRRAQFKNELLRKGIHLLVAFIPALADHNRSFTIILLCAGSVIYLTGEIFRMRGHSIPLLTRVTAFASRPREAGKFVPGPLTLALGAVLSLLIFPAITADSRAFHAAIYALAFGDGLSGLIGRPFGRFRPAFLFGKSIEGSIVCFVAVFISTCAVTGHPRISLATALTTTLVEALPLRNIDNIAIPLTAGFTVMLLSAT
ncbi:MAG: phosphatidate cytidylyltransferase [Spirochaetaceae bacterium]|jgi:dolichol kinase|nr:phosphatidate cytidylyltransferase [Spirochaetaceae bacterium]